MRLIERSRVARPPEQVWPFIADPERYRRWNDKIVSMDARGAFQAGRPFATRYRLNGKETQFLTTPVAVEENRLLELRHESPLAHQPPGPPRRAGPAQGTLRGRPAMTRARAALAAALAAGVLLPSRARGAAADLHVHWLMDRALPGVFRGEPGDGPAGLADETSRFRNQVGLADLKAADVRLVAAAVYAPPVLSSLRGGVHRELLRQLDALAGWVKAHPEATLVLSPEDAQKVLAAKEWRLGIIPAAEGGFGAASEAELEELWGRGLRLLTIAHFVDSPWAGAADVRYWPAPDCRPGGRDTGKRGALGLTPLGEKLSDWAVKKGLLLDLTHASDKAALALAARHPGLPLLFTHEAARELTPCERTISPELLRLVRKTGGMVGLTFADNYAGKNLDAVAAQAAALAREAGPKAVALGSDFNGLIRRPKGLPDASADAAVLSRLKAEGIPADRSAEAFVGLWRRSRAYGARLSAAGRRSPRPGRRRD